MPPDWHPILAAREAPLGVWTLVDPAGVAYGTVALRRVGTGEVRYRAEFRGVTIGWAGSLRLACERVHRAFLDAHGHGRRAPMADWGGTPWRLDGR